MSTRDNDDDLMAIADAVGVTAPPAHPEANARHIAHPSVRQSFTDDALAEMLDTWVAEAPVPYIVAEPDTEPAPECEYCEHAIDGDVHGGERGQTLCDECCWADRRGSYRACCEMGVDR